MLNNVRSEAATHLAVERKQGNSMIIIAYEVRVPLPLIFVSNVEAVMTFNNVLDSSKPDECCVASEEALELIRLKKKK